MAMTAEQSSGNPFRPGTGFVPPHMAGRELEQALLRKALTAITAKRKKYSPLRDGAPQPVKIVGPRGVGKTALLAWAQREAASLEADVVHWAHLKKVSSQEAFSEFLAELAKIPGWGKLQAEAHAYKHIQAALRRKPGHPPLQNFKGILEERLQLRPLLLLLDEVMHYDAGLLGKVLQQSQALIVGGWPLAIVLAGTPALNAHLQKVDATFINRARNIGINCLEPAATRDALSKPFVDRGVPVTDAALQLMLNWADDYPYFIQIAGSEVWDAREAAGCAEVDVSLVQSAEQTVLEQRDDFYESIYEIIRDAKLLAQARKVVAAIEAAAPKLLKPEQIEACLAKGTGLDADGTLDVYNQLLDAGLFWVPSGRNVRAAIPSFFNYFKKEYDQAHA